MQAHNWSGKAGGDRRTVVEHNPLRERDIICQRSPDGAVVAWLKTLPATLMLDVKQESIPCVPDELDYCGCGCRHYFCGLTLGSLELKIDKIAQDVKYIIRLLEGGKEERRVVSEDYELALNERKDNTEVKIDEYGIVVDVRSSRRISAGQSDVYMCQTWIAVYGGSDYYRQTVWDRLNEITWGIIKACEAPIGFIHHVPKMPPLVPPCDRPGPEFQATIIAAQPGGVVRSNMEDRRDRRGPSMKMFNVNFTIEICK